MTGDRGRGLDALRVYFNNSGLPSVMSFDQAVAHYDSKSPTMLERLGASVRIGEFNTDQLIRAFKPVIAQNSSELPEWPAFFDALAGDVSSVHFETLAKVVEQTVGDVKKTASSAFDFARLGLVAVSIVGVAYVVLQLSPILKRRRSS